MKLLTFGNEGSARLGALAADGGIVDLTRRRRDSAFRSMQTLIEAGAEALGAADRLIRGAAETLDPEEVRWLAPLPCPMQIRDFVGFEEHMRRAGWQLAKLKERSRGAAAPTEAPPIPPVWYDQPLYYKSNRFAVAGTGHPVAWPRDSNLIDYELELACVIGRGGIDISACDAADHIFGLCIFNDLTARDLQFKEMQGPFGPAKGKDFDGANVLGPVIVTTDEIGTKPALAMRAFVNGDLWSEGNSGAMYWSFERMIEHASRSETIYPGEILGSGTVGGGCGLELGRFLQHGDAVRLEIEGIGSVVTQIHAPHVPRRITL